MAAKPTPAEIRAARESLGLTQEQAGALIGMRDRAGADPREWPDDIRVREFPPKQVPQHH